MSRMVLAHGLGGTPCSPIAGVSIVAMQARCVAVRCEHRSVNDQFASLGIGGQRGCGQIAYDELFALTGGEINDRDRLAKLICDKQFFCRDRVPTASHNTDRTQTSLEDALRDKFLRRVTGVRLNLPFHHFECSRHRDVHSIANDRRPLRKCSVDTLQFGRDIALDVARRCFDSIRCVTDPFWMRLVHVGFQQIVKLHARPPCGNIESREIDGHNIVLDVAHLEIPRPINGIERPHDSLLTHWIGIRGDGIA